MNTDFRPMEALGERHAVDRFDSGVAELDRWLRRTAATAAMVGTAATYVLAGHDPQPAGPDDDDGDVEPKFEVAGYYSLAVRSIEQDLGPRLLGRGVPESVSVITLSRLALHRDLQGVGLGGELLVEALRRTVAAAHAVGARAVVVEAIDEAAYRFYQHFGFEDLEGMRLFKSIDDLEQALEPAT